jgi:hypothetical protein
VIGLTLHKLDFKSQETRSQEGDSVPALKLILFNLKFKRSGDRVPFLTARLL